MEAKESLASHIDWRDVDYKPAKHHRLLIDALEKLERREIRRLMVFMPPGSAKSTYGSVEFPIWYMGRRPKENIIHASHGEELAEYFGRRCRNIVADPKYQLLWEMGVAADSGAARRWENTKGGQYYAVGVGTSVTGRRGNLGLIDDPVKGKQAADSEPERNKVWNWYVNDFLTRLKPDAVQVLIMTRWHEDDLAGRILAREKDKWTVINIPMESEGDGDPLGRKKGEYLWTEYFTPEMIESAKADSRVWNSLYQQNPSPEKGIFFQREWFRRYRMGEEPRGMHYYASSDHAPAGNDNSDSNVLRIWGIPANGDLYMIDGFNKQCTMDDFWDLAEPFIKRYRPLCWFPENDNNWKSVAGFITKAMRKNKVFCRIEPISPMGSDKMVKAQSIQGMAKMGSVWIPVGPEYDQVIDQYVRFPAAKHDDDVDAGANMGRAIAETHPGVVDAPPPPPPKDSWDKVFSEEDDVDSWKTA